MAFCPSCGKELANEARFCPACGATQNQAPAASPVPVMTATGTQTGLQPNVAGLLCYALGWITGLIFFFIEKDRFVRFHAVQSIIVFGAIQIMQMVLVRLMFAISWRLWTVATLINTVFWIGELALWILLMVKAYNGEKFKLPTIGNLAEKYSA
ncbi:MAG TPA: zinc-ribbon domain-containing protein [Symbiobacteriaceae bacterium]|nr:zinc-ribbon domain-containing protein [Symbiobacteriaceae bacterium]